MENLFFSAAVERHAVHAFLIPLFDVDAEPLNLLATLPSEDDLAGPNLFHSANRLIDLANGAHGTAASEFITSSETNANFGHVLLAFTVVKPVQESRIFVETSKSRPTRARLRNRELADEAELVSLSVG